MWQKTHYYGNCLIKTLGEAIVASQRRGHSVLFFGTHKQFYESDTYLKVSPIGHFTETTTWAGADGTGHVEQRILIYKDEKGEFTIEELLVRGGENESVLFRIPYDGMAIAPYSPTANPRYSRSAPEYYQKSQSSLSQIMV